MTRKIERALRIVTLFVIIVAAVGVGLAGFTVYFENLQSGQNVVEVSQEEQDTALLGCMEFGSPHAIILNDVVYCHMIYQGTDYIAPLEDLKAR